MAAGNIDRIAPATFSHNLYTFDDGFQPYSGGAHNYYGEDGEFIVLDAPVFLTSLDVQFPFLTLPVPTSVTLRMFDAGGDTTFYGDDGRPHAWYIIDNLTFDEPRPGGSVAEPATLVLVCAGLALAFAARRCGARA